MRHLTQNDPGAGAGVEAVSSRRRRKIQVYS
jgi:hypothetical protein